MQSETCKLRTVKINQMTIRTQLKMALEGEGAKVRKMTIISELLIVIGTRTVHSIENIF